MIFVLFFEKKYQQLSQECSVKVFDFYLKVDDYWLHNFFLFITSIENLKSIDFFIAE